MKKSFSTYRCLYYSSLVPIASGCKGDDAEKKVDQADMVAVIDQSDKNSLLSDYCSVRITDLSFSQLEKPVSSISPPAKAKITLTASTSDEFSCHPLIFRNT